LQAEVRSPRKSGAKNTNANNGKAFTFAPRSNQAAFALAA